jgi:FkbM family methyltransferase
MLKPADATQLVPVVCGDLARIGAPNDGGYVVPLAVVRQVKYLISFGLSLDWTFEEDFVRHNRGVIVHCYDHTVSARRIAIHSLKHLGKLPLGPSKQRRQESLRYLSYRMFFRGRIHHYHHRTRIWDSTEGDSATIHDVFAKLAPGGGVFLKMDIEGSEYRVLADLAAYASRIDAMVIEFHDIHLLAERFDAAIAQLRKEFHVVHVHGNNYRGLSPSGLPNVLEITFQNRRLFNGTPQASSRSYPVQGLDAPNNPARPDLELHFLSRIQSHATQPSNDPA